MINEEPFQKDPVLRDLSELTVHALKRLRACKGRSSGKRRRDARDEQTCK